MEAQPLRLLYRIKMKAITLRAQVCLAAESTLHTQVQYTCQIKGLGLFSIVHLHNFSGINLYLYGLCILDLNVAFKR